MHRVLFLALLVLMLAVSAQADEACGGDGAGAFPGLGGTAGIFGLSEGVGPVADDSAEEDCADAILMDVEPRPGMLVELVSPPVPEALVCAVSSEAIETYRARHGEVDYLLAPEAALPAGSWEEGARASVRIAHVITTDPDYVSPEGLRVGDPVERALAAFHEGGAVFTAGGLCLMLPSGWTACFAPEDAGITPGGLMAPQAGAPIRDFHLM